MILEPSRESSDPLKIGKMNEQSLQQILNLHQVLTTAAAAAVIQSLLNPNQAATNNPLASALTPQAAANVLANATANNQVSVSDSSINPPSTTATSTPPISNDLSSQQLLQLQHALHLSEQLRQQQQLQPQSNPATATSPTQQQQAECNNNQRIQDLLLQLQSQAPLGPQTPMALNLNNLTNLANQMAPTIGVNANPIRSPANLRSSSDVSPQIDNATNSNTHSNNNKKLKRHHHHHHQQTPQSQHNIHQSHQSPYHNRPTEATSKSQLHTTPKNHSAISNLGRNSSGSHSGNNTSSPSPSSFLANNVSLPRKLVRGQDVWLGRGAEQTRQILKCMWCGQSFRTLAEMAQHMKVTQHYTNIISQEQITSWRQPENATESNNKQNKSSAQVRGIDQNLDGSSDKLDGSDGEDSFSDDEDLDQRNSRIRVRQEVNNSAHDSHDNVKSELDFVDSPDGVNSNSQGSKPMTRSRKRESDSSTSKSHQSIGIIRETSPSTSSSRQRMYSNNQAEQAESNSESIKDGKIAETNEMLTNDDPDDDEEIKHVIKGMLDEEEHKISKQTSNNNNSSSNNNNNNTNDNREEEEQDEEEPSMESDMKGSETPDQENGDNSEDEVDGSDVENKNDIANENNSSMFDDQISPASVTKSTIGGKGDTGDPLSALETMVEKSFDPRLRPGMANGGILQRLGIDEEVCPPWQHINYANWYAAAACGHPMAAALLAAGLNLQNGIRLSKNVSPKKNDE